ncbi:hypothetical protein Pla100_05970 [Neorhodopirellula pilleata]|uniref:Uncharacterized protein n=1 Tax=Neorhodopirellula pilleata TaxID=2714738 RepID=A0A5C6AVZ9_9BACT|nr:hypothetical protein Pla100_05970 [Neorhodopirellula pilleata]
MEGGVHIPPHEINLILQKRSIQGYLTFNDEKPEGFTEMNRSS